MDIPALEFQKMSSWTFKSTNKELKYRKVFQTTDRLENFLHILPLSLLKYVTTLGPVSSMGNASVYTEFRDFA